MRRGKEGRPSEVHRKPRGSLWMDCGTVRQGENGCVMKTEVDTYCKPNESLPSQLKGENPSIEYIVVIESSHAVDESEFGSKEEEDHEELSLP